MELTGYWAPTTECVHGQRILRTHFEEKKNEPLRQVHRPTAVTPLYRIRYSVCRLPAGAAQSVRIRHEEDRLPVSAQLYDGDRLPRDALAPGAERVAIGDGVATRKYDGTCCMVRHGKLFKRYDAKAAKTPPIGFEPA